MSSNINKWKILMQTPEEQKYMIPLSSYVLKLFGEIFGVGIINSETCLLYNDEKAAYPMLIINRNPIMIRTNVEKFRCWEQFIFQLSHEMTHYIIRQYKTDKTAIVKWFEETICEAMSLYILRVSSMRWIECALHSIKPNYGVALEFYWRDVYKQTEESVLKRCHTLHELELVEEACETNRKGRSIERNYLFNTFCDMPNSIAEFVYYPLYMHGDLQIDFETWTSNQNNNLLIPHLKAIQPKLTAS
ncbi:hypothetical protein OBV_20270 [Oscillibacter valericigenes Sjm18-20]|nr:hypothetical protein OBV_20270 [Oscillibacter valericigenes Sjm18-20]